MHLKNAKLLLGEGESLFEEELSNHWNDGHKDGVWAWWPPLIQTHPFLLYLYSTSMCHPTLNQIKDTLLYFFLSPLWQWKQQNLRFSAIENNFFPLFYEVTRLKSIIKTGKVKKKKTLKNNSEHSAICCPK